MHIYMRIDDFQSCLGAAYVTMTWMCVVVACGVGAVSLQAADVLDQEKKRERIKQAA